MRRQFAIAIVLSLGCMLTVSAVAQGPAVGPPARYQPSRPTISPYLNLLRRDAGPIPNYYTLVRPQLNQIDINQRQRVTNQQQQGQISANARNITELKESGAAATGTASVYRNFGHYYPNMK